MTMGTSASSAGAGSASRADFGERLLERDAPAIIGLCERAVDRCVQLLALDVAHSVVVSLDAGEQGVRDLQSHGLVERKELLEELRRSGHA